MSAEANVKNLQPKAALRHWHELLFVFLCAIAFDAANNLQHRVEFEPPDDLTFATMYVYYGWPAPCMRVERGGFKPIRDGFHYLGQSTIWSGLVLNATFTIAVAVLGVLAIRLLRHRRFTLTTGGVFVFYVCIAAGALNAALAM